MEPIFPIILALVILGIWLWSEFRDRRAIRVFFGLVCIFLWSCASTVLTNPAKELHRARTGYLHRVALMEMKRQLDIGGAAQVTKALAAYDDVYYRETNGGAEAANIELLRVLREGTQDR